MEHLYNPDQMSEQEIKATFVARQALVDRLVTLIARQPEGAGVRHVVLVAPRGMGKTTMLLMVQFAVTDRGLAPPWLPIRFPEELYGVTDLADFWLETLDSVSRVAGDEALAQSAADLKRRYRDSETLSEATLALLRDWCRRHGRRLVLLVDNFNQILRLMDEQQAAALRRVLMNEGWVMILGAAPSFFHEASGYDEPLYNFFQIEHLERLDFQGMRALLLQRAAADGLADFEKNLDANTIRLRVLEYFTGGNVRLVLMLYRVVAQSAILEVREGLDKLLDQVTPFYKAKTEDLPPQQRKILDHIARTSAQTREGASPSEIAEATRLTPQVVSAQLKRLADTGYVQPANLRGRTTSYTLSEPLYSLWYQMRFGRDARERMAWLVGFLKGFYTVEELGEQSSLLEGQFQTLLAAGREHEARNALEHRRWLAEAMPDRAHSARVMEGVIRGYLTLKDPNTLKDEVLADDQLPHLSHETLDQLVAAGCLTADRAAQVRSVSTGSEEAKMDVEAEAAFHLGNESYERGEFEQALASYDRALELDPQDANTWGNRGIALANLGRYEEAVASYDRSLELDPQDANAWGNRGNSLGDLGRYEEALASYDRSLELDPQKMNAWYNRGIALADLGRYEEALASYDRALANVLEHEKGLRTRTYLSMFLAHVDLGQTALAAEDWHAAVLVGAKNEEWQDDASRLLLAAAQQGQGAFVRELIANSHTEEQFFPLVRALDYLATGDEALIEKLTPEMRPIVEQVVATLRPAMEAAGTPQPKPRTRRKNGSPGRAIPGTG